MHRRTLLFLLSAFFHQSLCFVPFHIRSISQSHYQSQCLRQQFRAAIRPKLSILSLKSQGGPPLDVEPMELSEENVRQALNEAKEKLGTIFGNSKENLQIGITGNVELVDLDGPFVTLRLIGRFWHKRADVLARVTNYLNIRIPEIVEVSIEDPRQLDDKLTENMKL